MLAYRLMMALVLLWILVLGTNTVGANNGGCEAIISEEIPHQLPVSQLDTNESHPAVVRCQVTCLNQQGSYYPAMALNITSQERFIEVLGQCMSSSRDGLYYKIHIGDISYCEAQNNYTMKFEYLIYSNNSKIDHSIVKCGVRFSSWYTYSWHTCWGQSYGTIHYNPESAPTHTSSEDCPVVEILGLSSINFVGWLMLTLIFITVMVVIIIILPLIGGFLYMRSHRTKFKSDAIVPCVQTVEQTLVIKIDNPTANEEEMREKETSLCAESNHSSVQVQLDQKLPDTISSRSTETS